MFKKLFQSLFATIPTAKAVEQSALWRPLHALNLTRVVIAGLLLLFWGLGSYQSAQTTSFFTYFSISTFYLVIAGLFALYSFFDRRNLFPQLVTQISVDLLIVSVFYLVAGGMKGGMAILFLFPLASAAILMHRSLALFFASIVTIFMLADALSRAVRGQGDSIITQAGLYGAAFFAVAYFLNSLASRLIDQQKLAIQRERELKVQETINRLVIAEMEDGVMVVSGRGTIITCNPAAQHMLGIVWNPRTRTRLTDVTYLKPLSDAFFSWRKAKTETTFRRLDPVAFVNIKPAEDNLTTTILRLDHSPALGRHLKIRFSSVATEPLHQELGLIFLQDVARIDEKAQQLKLASMGRLTASIAHEVRNPLAAISHASALFGEDVQSPAQQRLLKIVADNVSRLNRMVEDILNLSRRVQTQEPINLAESINEIKASFQELHRLPANFLRVDIPKLYRVRFDPVHLREVLLNLLNNALRYASGTPGCIRLFTVYAAPNRLELHVQDDGAPITPEVRAHLFEPFYTTSRQGTGLGLYLARELCSNNGAMLDYESHPDTLNPGSSTGRFVITFAAPDMNQRGLSA